MAKNSSQLAKGQPFGKIICSMCHTQRVARSASKMFCESQDRGRYRWVGPMAERACHTMAHHKEKREKKEMQREA